MQSLEFHENLMINVSSVPHEACQRREGLQLDRRSAQIDVGLVFAAVSDAHKVPLANQIARGRRRDLVGDDGFRSDVFQDLRVDTESRAGAVRVGVGAVLRLLLGGSAHLDLLNAGVPRAHLLHSEKQNIVELVHAGLQDRLQPEDPPAPRRDFTVDDVSVALTKAEDVQKLFQQLLGGLAEFGEDGST